MDKNIKDQLNENNVEEKSASTTENKHVEEENKTNSQKESIVGNVTEKVKDKAKSAILGKIYSTITTLVVIAAILIFLWWNPLNWNLNFFNGGFAKIDKTENVVEEIKKISEFTTACYYEEMVIQNTKDVKKEDNAINSLAKFVHIGNDSVHNEVVLIVKGKVRAGFNLQKVSNENFIVNSDSLSITVPQAEIFDVIINPSDYEVYVEDGKWSHEEIVKIQTEIEALLKQKAIAENILDKANTFGVEKLKTLFKSFGFAYVNVKIEEKDNPIN